MRTDFHFDSQQQYQLDAIAAVVDLFDGQPQDAARLITPLRDAAAVESGGKGQLTLGTALDAAPDMTQEVGAIGNHLILDETTILTNLQAVQNRNGLVVSDGLADEKLDFDIEMETGTGKTYVYLRTIFELAARYSFTKFIILVPSVAIREGVNTSIGLMREHLRDLYARRPFDVIVYRGDRAEEVHAFATATSVQILVMTIDAIRGDRNTRIIHQRRDKLNGLRPLDYLKATRPVVIMDEPQNMESELSQSVIGELEPAFTLRYSATHKRPRNLVYRLDPVDAHDLKLVKQIVVAEVTQQGADAAPYVKLLAVKSMPKWSAKLELACRMADGSLARKAKTVKLHQELKDVTGNPAYVNWRINEMRIADGLNLSSVELTQHGVLQEGQSIGGANDAIYKEMIRETVCEHLRREVQLRPKNIKVLSLFFVDRVASFLGGGTNNEDANGDFARWFDEVFIEERGKDKRYQELLPQEPRDLRRAYFSQFKKGGAVQFKDSTGNTKADDDAYELIMRDKSRLLDGAEPVRFIFSHSALCEGWDNPNVFQICTLREMGAETERRQTLGRGLRLPVAQTPTGYERVSDPGIATLSVIANESYTAFAKNLQNEYKAAGVAIGQVRANEFAKMPRLDASGNDTGEACGYQWSKEVFEHLEKHHYIQDGQTTSQFLPDSENFSLHLPEGFQPYEQGIIDLMRRASLERYVQPRSARQKRKFNKALYATPEFKNFWDAISQKTTYRVEIKPNMLIQKIVAAIKKQPPVAPLHIQVTRAGVKVLRGGTLGRELGTRNTNMTGRYDLPDIVDELQQASALTRKTLVNILVDSQKLSEFIGNPNDFIAMVKQCIHDELAGVVARGVQYEKIGGLIYELQELQQDGEEEKKHFLNEMIKIQNHEKTDFDYVVFASDVERKFAELLDSREDIKLFMKLPSKFKVYTPVGNYNPDWAIIKQVNGEDRIYMIRETKSTPNDKELLPFALAKIESARKHFKAIGITSYERSTPGKWNLD